jgi:transcriptional regulator with XRE-family HTH domain
MLRFLGRGVQGAPQGCPASLRLTSEVTARVGALTVAEQSNPVRLQPVAPSERKAPMALQTPRSFNSWLRGQLKEKKMSQRQLALHAGVDHSTISRLLKGERLPSLGTATRLARGLREILDEADGPGYFASLTNRQMLPTSRVEYALRGDDALTESDVRELMQSYLSIRARRIRDGVNGNGFHT